MQNHYRGNNLLETIVITSIIIVLAIIAIPSVSDLLLRNDMENAQSTVVDTLRLAKQTAVSQNTEIAVHISNRTISISPANSDEKNTIELPKRVNIDHPHQLVFLPDGSIVRQKNGRLLSLSDLTITIKSSSDYNLELIEQVSINSLGGIAGM